MARRCPHCGAHKDYKYYLINFVAAVSLTYVAFKVLDYELHLVEWVKYLINRFS